MPEYEVKLTKTLLDTTIEAEDSNDALELAKIEYVGQGGKQEDVEDWEVEPIEATEDELLYALESLDEMAKNNNPKATRELIEEAKQNYTTLLSFIKARFEYEI